MKQNIFRVDDRLIHGQVIEGWIKNFGIARVAIVNDRIVKNPMQQMIYQSVVPHKTQIAFYSVKNFISEWLKAKKAKGQLMVIFESIDDLMLCESLIDEDIYINIGCISSREHTIEVSDTVFLERDELDKLTALADRWKIHIKKLPWEKDANFAAFNKSM